MTCMHGQPPQVTYVGFIVACNVVWFSWQWGENPKIIVNPVYINIDTTPMPLCFSMWQCWGEPGMTASNSFLQLAFCNWHAFSTLLKFFLGNQHGIVKARFGFSLATTGKTKITCASTLMLQLWNSQHGDAGVCLHFYLANCICNLACFDCCDIDTFFQGYQCCDEGKTNIAINHLYVQPAVTSHLYMVFFACNFVWFPPAMRGKPKNNINLCAWTSKLQLCNLASWCGNAEVGWVDFYLYFLPQKCVLQSGMLFLFIADFFPGPLLHNEEKSKQLSTGR